MFCFFSGGQISANKERRCRFIIITVLFPSRTFKTQSPRLLFFLLHATNSFIRAFIRDQRDCEILVLIFRMCIIRLMRIIVPSHSSVTTFGSISPSAVVGEAAEAPERAPTCSEGRSGQKGEKEKEYFHCCHDNSGGILELWGLTDSRLVSLRVYWKWNNIDHQGGTEEIITPGHLLFEALRIQISHVQKHNSVASNEEK